MQVRSKQTAEERFRHVHSECCTLAQEIIDAHVKHLKLCHADLPEPTLRQEVMKHRYCVCAIASEILDTPA
jgi:hypothetical protein